MARTKPPKTYNHNFPLVRDRDFRLLSQKRRRFVYNYYLKSMTRWTDAQCYREAYCRPDMNQATAASCASKLLRKVRVARVIKKLDEIELDRLGITAEKLLIEESNLAFADIANLYDEDGHLTIPPNRLPLAIRKALAGVKVTHGPNGEKHYEYKLWDKGASLKRLAQIKGMGQTKRVQLSGPEGGPIESHNTITNIDVSKLTNEELEFLTGILDKMPRQREE